MTYEGMEISNGNQAGLVYNKLVKGELNSEDRDQLRDEFWEYCGQDTLGMVELIKVLEDKNIS